MMASEHEDDDNARMKRVCVGLCVSAHRTNEAFQVLLHPFQQTNHHPLTVSCHPKNQTQVASASFWLDGFRSRRRRVVVVVGACSIRKPHPDVNQSLVACVCHATPLHVCTLMLSISPSKTHAKMSYGDAALLTVVVLLWGGETTVGPRGFRWIVRAIHHAHTMGDTRTHTRTLFPHFLA